MNWEQLKKFYFVAKVGNLSKASEEMGISQGALSRQIGQLETSLKIKLFHRHSRGLQLTKSGEVLYKAACDIYAQASLVEARIINTTEYPSGILKVSAPISFGTFWLAPRIIEFTNCYPDISIQLYITDAEIDLSMGNVDVALRYPVVEAPGLVRKTLKVIRFYPFAAPSYLSKYGVPEHPRDLDHHRIIAFRRKTSEDYSKFNWMLSADTTKTDKRIPILEVDNIYTGYMAIKSGLGIGLLPEYYAWDSSDTIKILNNCEYAYERKLGLYYPESLRGLAKIKVFNEFVYKITNPYSL